MALIRLNKYLSQQGICSRREADRFIEQGLVSVNGQVVTELGTKVDPVKDKITADDQLIQRQEELIYIMLNKPAGYVTSVKPTKAEPDVVMDLIDLDERVYPVGRLDKDTTGLLILTNDGTLTFKLTHPSSESEKEYEVTVEGVVTNGAMEKLRQGVRLWGEKTKPAKVRKITKNKMSIILTEGKNRQVRRICQKVGLPVKELKRIRTKGVKLGHLPLGQWRHLTEGEVASLKN